MLALLDGKSKDKWLNPVSAIFRFPGTVGSIGYFQIFWHSGIHREAQLIEGNHKSNLVAICVHTHVNVVFPRRPIRFELLIFVFYLLLAALS
jgi:hypothetical protein